MGVPKFTFGNRPVDPVDHDPRVDEESTGGRRRRVRHEEVGSRRTTIGVPCTTGQRETLHNERTGGEEGLCKDKGNSDPVHC